MQRVSRRRTGWAARMGVRVLVYLSTEHQACSAQRFACGPLSRMLDFPKPACTAGGLHPHQASSMRAVQPISGHGASPQHAPVALACTQPALESQHSDPHAYDPALTFVSVALEVAKSCPPTFRCTNGEGACSAIAAGRHAPSWSCTRPRGGAPSQESSWGAI